MFRKLLRIINPTTTIRLWTAEGMDWSGGRFKSFWLKRNALKVVEEFKEWYLFVDLICELTGKTVRLKDNPDNVECVIWIDESGEISQEVYDSLLNNERVILTHQ